MSDIHKFLTAETTRLTVERMAVLLSMYTAIIATDTGIRSEWINADARAEYESLDAWLVRGVTRAIGEDDRRA